MRPERWASLVLALALSLGSAPQPARTEKSRVGKPTVPLVRKDLLVFAPGAILPPRRDIFHPRTSAPPVPPPAALGGTPGPKGQRTSVPAPPSFALDLIYVGSVRAGGTITALVTRNGQTLPVAVGDEVIPGYRVLRITPDEIEVVGPNSERKTFTRQGDRP